MSKQDSIFKQVKTSTDMDDEFENIENIVLKIFKLLHEYDELIEMAEKENETINNEDC